MEVLSKGYQIHPDALNLLEKIEGKFDILRVIEDAIKTKKEGIVITKEDVLNVLPEEFIDELEPRRKEKVILESFEEIKDELVIKFDPTNKLKPSEGIKSFQKLFLDRYRRLMKIVRNRPDSYQIQKISSLNRTNNERGRKIAGLVMEKRIRRNKAELTIDDDTGSLNVIALNDKVRKNLEEVCQDQLVVVELDFSKKGLAIVKNIIHPDIPDKVINTSKKEVYAILTSDLHVGSKAFMLEAFKRFLYWLSGKNGDLDIVKKIKYLIIAGDLIDGVGVYPEQEAEIEKPDVKMQIEMAKELLAQIPKHIRILISVGNHDPVRQALPQPSLPKDFANSLTILENVNLVGNPCYIGLHGVNVLVYHGQSLYDIIATIPNQSFSKPASAMKILLKTRHLAPIYGQRTQIAPEEKDYLVIEDIPDILHSGHVHVLDSTIYKGTLLINSGAWQERTRYQINMGIEPTPSIVPIINLSTFEVITKDFTKPLKEL
jgi:DNA polymerase II small subunit